MTERSRVRCPQCGDALAGDGSDVSLFRRGEFQPFAVVHSRCVKAFSAEHGTPDNPVFRSISSGSITQPAASDQWTRWWASGGKSELAALLARHWDPIFRGMRLQAGDDEYIDFADAIGPTLRSGISLDDLQRYLFEAEELMRLKPDEADRRLDKTAATEILDWYQRAAPSET